MQYYQLSKQWRLEQKGTDLFVIGGQDAIFTVDLEGDSPSFFSKLNHNKKFEAENLIPVDRLILEQLVSAEVVIPSFETQSNRSSHIKLKLVGKKSVLSAFKLDTTDYSQTTTNDYDLLILVRTNETYKGFLNEHHYLDLKKPHLLLDLSFNHTVSLGPLVFPGVTSCIACLEGRIGARWGDEIPPLKPKSLSSLVALSKEWLLVELNRLFKEQDYTLVNKTLVLDMQSRTITSNKLLTVTVCPYCQKSKLLSTGKLEYTFSKA